MRVDLSLLLVIRGGLWLGECLDGTDCRANGSPETLPRTFVSDSSEIIVDGHPLSMIDVRIRALSCLHRQFLRIPELSSLPHQTYKLLLNHVLPTVLAARGA